MRKVIFISAITLLCASVASTGQGSDSLPEFKDTLRKLQPRLTKTQSKRLESIFRKVANEESCGIQWQILASIAFNESSLGFNTVNERTKDYGLMQINERTITRLALNKDKVMRDTTYAVRAACKVLRHNKDRYAEKLTYWVGIYRSGTALWKESIRDNAKRYNRIILATAETIGYEVSLYADAR
jgi:hypothetical protein